MRILKQISLLLCIIMLLCSCGGNIDSPPAFDVIPSPQASVASGSLRLQMRRPDTFNPLLTQYKSCRDIYDLIYDSLVNIDENFHPYLNLAQDLSFSQDRRVLTVNLKNNIKWHDGTSFSAADVVYTVSFLKEHDSSFSALLDSVESVSQFGSSTVIFNLTEPDTGFVNKLTFPIIRENSGESPYSPIGTGQYRFDGIVNSNELHLIANDSYHLGTPNISAVNVLYCSTDYKAITSFESGQIDLLTDSVDFSTIAAKDVYSLTSHKSSTFVFIGLNHSRQIFQSAAVRRAVSTSIDRNALTAASVVDKLTPANAPIHSSSYLYSSELDSLAPNQSLAASLLFDDGWVQNSALGTPEKDGQSLSFELLVCSEDASRKTTADLIASQLASVGFSVRVTAVDRDTYNLRLSSIDYDAVIAESSVSSFQNLDFLLGNSNPFNYSSAVMDLRLSALRAAEPEESVIDEARKFMRYFSESQPLVGLYFKDGAVLHNVSVNIPMIESERVYKNLYTWSKN